MDRLKAYILIVASMCTVLSGCTDSQPSFDQLASESPQSPPPNQAPTISATCSSTLSQGVDYGCTPTYNDVNGDTAIWGLAAGHSCAWATIDTSTGQVAGNPDDDQVGTCTIAFVASDGSFASNTLSYPVTVNNLPPTLSISSPSPILEDSAATMVRSDLAVEADEEGFGTYNLIPAASSPDCSSHGSVSHDTAEGSVMFTPAADYFGTCYVQIEFDDGNGGVASSEFGIDVTAVNDSPSAVSHNCAAAIEINSAYTCSASATDVDSAITYTLSAGNTCGWAMINSATGAISGSPATADNCTLEIKASDGALFTTATVNVDVNLPAFVVGAGFTSSTNVIAMASDPVSHKLYVAGNFSFYKGVSRVRLVRLHPNGDVDTSFIPPAFNGTIKDLHFDGGTGKLYVAGAFSNSGYAYLERLNNDGSNDVSFNPTLDGAVYKVVVQGSTMYIGGLFTTVTGNSRNYLAAIDLTTGLTTSWNPNANSYINALALNGSTIYVGGMFTNIGGTGRNRIAAIDSTTGIATSWNPNASSTVQSILLNGSDVLVGGAFTSIGGQSRNYLAAIDVSTGLAKVWNPDMNASVISMTLHGSDLWIGGAFTMVSGNVRNSLAKFSTVDYSLKPATGAFDAPVYSILPTQKRVYAGGSFLNFNASPSAGIAAFDPITGLAN